MLVKKISFRVNSQLQENEDGINIQKGIVNILDEYKKNHYFSKLYKGYSDLDIVNEKAYVTEYEEQEFRGYLEECEYKGKKNYKMYIKDYKGECFHIGYVPFSKVPEIEEWLDDNSDLDLKGSVYILGGKTKYYDENNNKLVNENKEYEFEVELRFYKEDEAESKTQNKKVTKMNFKYAFIILSSTILSFIILLSMLVGIFIITKRTKFEITDFSMSTDTTKYTSIPNTTTYEGKGLITTKNKKETYLVALKVDLVSGGSENSESYCTMVTINNGKGEFVTYDSGDEGKITKPEYKFEILGYIKF